MAASKKKSPQKVDAKEKRSYVNSDEMPSYTLESALKIAQTLYDNFGSKGASPHQVAIALEISPTSSSWRYLTGASAAYGLTTGAAQANEISLTQLGKRLVAPESEGDDLDARVVACLKPRVIKEFFERYDRNKFPKDVIAKNVLVTLGVPKEKADEAYDKILANGKYAGIIQETKTGPFVFVNSKTAGRVVPDPGFQDKSGNTNRNDQTDDEDLPDELAKNLGFQKNVKSPTETLPTTNQKARVFISHGKNKKIVDQLKEILTFGQFEVVVSVEKESTAIPVPEKVFSDMRYCDAAVIHVESELELLDGEGKPHFTINENVLIEIGAAIALYGKNFVLLCESSLKLPSNLQGLYRCNYDGKELNYDATMKLLKAFNGFRNKAQEKQ